MDRASLDAVAPLPKGWVSLAVDSSANGTPGALPSLVLSARLAATSDASEEYDVFRVSIPVGSPPAQRSLKNIAMSADQTMLGLYKGFRKISSAVRPGFSGTELQPQSTFRFGPLVMMTRYSENATSVYIIRYSFLASLGPNPGALKAMDMLCATRHEKT